MKQGQLVLGTEQRETNELLKGLGGESTVGISENATAKCWSLKAYRITVETQIEGGVVSHLNLWDWRKGEPPTDLAQAEYHSVDEINFKADGTVDYSILETFNPGK